MRVTRAHHIRIKRNTLRTVSLSLNRSHKPSHNMRTNMSTIQTTNRPISRKMRTVDMARMVPNDLDCDSPTLVIDAESAKSDVILNSHVDHAKRPRMSVHSTHRPAV